MTDTMIAEQNGQTALDLSHGAMIGAPENGNARLKFYHQLADATLFLLLEKEPVDETIAPETFELSDATYVLAFDSEERLAEFANSVVPYVALSGRVIAGLLRDQNIGLGLNVDVAPSSILLPATALNWLCETLDTPTFSANAEITAIAPPSDIAKDIVAPLAASVRNNGAAATAAFLVSVRYSNATSGALVGFIGAPDAAHAPLAKAISEALIFSGNAADAVGVGFFTEGDPVAIEMARRGIEFEINRPEPQALDPASRVAPGSDPLKPPILR